MYGLLNYNPYGPHAPPQPDEVPESQFKAAQRVNATHLSADGKQAYCTRYGQTLVAKWDKWDGFGAWEPVSELPNDAVVIDGD